MSRKCRKAQNKAYYEANKERIAARYKAYYEANKERIAARYKAHYQANKEKIKAYNKAHYEANKEKAIVTKKAYYEANKEEMKAYQAAYRKANKEKKKAYNKAHYEANKEKVAAYNKANGPRRNATEAKRKALKIKNLPTQVRDCPIEKKRLYITYKLCALFTKATGVKHHVDHMWPLSDGGPHWSGNLQIITAEENLSKKDKVDPNIKATIQEMLKDIKDAY
jgi:5-methylcytosine-specific restriction endonuclease McrA